MRARPTGRKCPGPRRPETGEEVPGPPARPARRRPAIKARAAEVGATILFADEASVRTDYHAGTTWAPVGQTPVVTASAVRQAVKMVSAIGQRGELSFQVHEGSMLSLIHISEPTRPY